MYPFGFGLSYGQFTYNDVKVSAPTVKKKQSVEVEAKVTNTGKVEADEVVQLYITDVAASSQQNPLYSLKGIRRITLKPGASETVKFTITPEMMEMVNDKGERILEPGLFKVSIGGSLPTARSKALGGGEGVQASFTLK